MLLCFKVPIGLNVLLEGFFKLVLHIRVLGYPSPLCRMIRLVVPRVKERMQRPMSELTYNNVGRETDMYGTVASSDSGLSTVLLAVDNPKIRSSTCETTKHTLNPQPGRHPPLNEVLKVI